jgi:spoIIIJ-associated protein
MEWIETTAKTVDEAKDLALVHLGVGTEDAEFEVLDEPKTGLFGRLRGEARVRARVRPTKPRPKVERRDRRRTRAGSGDEERTSANGDHAEGATTSAKPSRSKSGKNGRAKQAPSGRDEGGSESIPPTDAPGDEQRATRSRPAKQSKSTNKTSTKQTTSAGGTEMTNDAHERASVDPQQVATSATDFLEGLTTAFGLEATASSSVEGIEVEVRVDGADLGLLVGPRGSTLDAVQDLTRVVAQRRLGDQDTRLRVDVAGYRERRREALGRFALQMADEVVASGVARVLEPMGSADRKIVHDALSTRDDVTTRSEGDDPQRRVVITPKA